LPRKIEQYSQDAPSRLDFEIASLLDSQVCDIRSPAPESDASLRSEAWHSQTGAVKLKLAFTRLHVQIGLQATNVFFMFFRSYAYHLAHALQCCSALSIRDCLSHPASSICQRCFEFFLCM